jgi:hypothetical protein
MNALLPNEDLAFVDQGIRGGPAYADIGVGERAGQAVARLNGQAGRGLVHGQVGDGQL